ncbi:GntR family transcriptional regulator [Roseiarcus fermentans]|uniref:GntR family transcriptional regulator n=1 Tax=Roseiarcus fermentans TaxID=1473586 RepID=A0A366ELL2_9HYPH|nr:FCD domain-containing protein [Roseiarcus fermentans]RBP02876.1 GntR family transcriptional regulator [Roseiarcus fermentans]
MSSKTQSDRMFDALRADILACRILPGSKLRINDIAATSEVSLGAVREALSRLGAEDLVIAESQKGYRVAPLSVEDLQDLTEARVEIEGAALARSIARGDLDWETNLVAAWHRLSRISEREEDDRGLPTDQWALAHGAFHEALVKACGSAKLLQIRSQLYQQTERYRRYSGVVDRDRDVAGEHRRIFDAAIARDGAEAAKAISEHLRATAAIITGSFGRPDAADDDKRRRAV